MANDYIGVVTPAGTAIYPHLTQPDTKFNAMGEYKVSLSLTEDEAAPIDTWLINRNNNRMNLHMICPVFILFL